jgi:hypothetical protein
MISTPEQYKATQEWVAAFEGNLQRLAAKDDGGEDPRVRKIQMDAYASFIGTLRDELTEYEARHPERAAAREEAFTDQPN